MAKRGRKAIDLRYLGFWEQQWYQAFHHMREGRTMPVHPSWWRLSDLGRDGLRTRLRKIEHMSIEEYWSDFIGQVRRNLGEPGALLSANREQAKQLRADEIHSLGRRIEPAKIRARSERAEI